MGDNATEHAQFYTSPVQFQMPHFVLGGTPSLAHGGGAEVLPGMYGQGTQAWTEYDKYWYDQSGPSKYYSLSDPGDPQHPHASRVAATPRPFEFDSPQVDTPSTPGMPTIALEPREPPPDPLALIPPAPTLALSAPAPTYALPTPNFLDPTAPLPPLPPHGLPLYSASGFDMLRFLAKVATRPHPRIMLGPVDMTCSFVVVDVRRVDAPIVYASPTFTRLTGYTESEVVGRNCRFLQSPTGHVPRGSTRLHTAPDAVRHLHKSLLQDKECQASLINYRKDGGAFINLVTVIPVSAPEDEDEPAAGPGWGGEITHCVGFQVDLAEQPNAILQKLRDGSYIVNYSAHPPAPAHGIGITGPGLGGFTGPGMAPGWTRERRTRGVSIDMLGLLRRLRRAASRVETGEPPKNTRDAERAELHALLLENTDDFVHVVSLKGSLLYVAPAVTRVLGHDPAALIGTSIAALCHPADVVPLMRELKDASSSAPAPAHTTHNPLYFNSALTAAPHAIATHTPPKPLSLLFRALHKTQGWVWLEARGRLHVEQGKGRKAVVLVGRRVDVGGVRWGVARGLGDDAAGEPEADGECWGLVAPNGIILAAGEHGARRLGLAPARLARATTSTTPAPTLTPNYNISATTPTNALTGRSLASLVLPPAARHVGEVLAAAAAACAGAGAGAEDPGVRRVRCRMRVFGSERAHAGADVSSDLSVASEPPSAPACDGEMHADGGGDGPSVPVEIRFFTREPVEPTRVLPPRLVFQLVFLRESDAGEGTLLRASARPQRPAHENVLAELETASIPVPLSPPSSASELGVGSKRDPGDAWGGAASPATTSTPTVPVPRSRPSKSARIVAPSAPTPILAISTSPVSPAPSPTATTTTPHSWQYELTRLRFENERMREEAGVLERVVRARARAGVGARVGVGPGVSRQVVGSGQRSLGPGSLAGPGTPTADLGASRARSSMAASTSASSSSSAPSYAGWMSRGGGSASPLMSSLPSLSPLDHGHGHGHGSVYPELEAYSQPHPHPHSPAPHPYPYPYFEHPQPHSHSPHPHPHSHSPHPYSQLHAHSPIPYLHPHPSQPMLPSGPGTMGLRGPGTGAAMGMKRTRDGTGKP